MANLDFKLLPPILEASQPAFLSSVDNYAINFSIPNTVNQANIRHMQARISYVVSNRSAVRPNSNPQSGEDLVAPDGIIYQRITNRDTTTQALKNKFFNIVKSDLLRGWEAGTYYKVQIRFGTAEELPWVSDASQYAPWKLQQAEQHQFSEWSTVMIIKPIEEPNVKILNNQLDGTDINSTSEYLETSINPLFIGGYACSMASMEKLLHYKFELYNDDKELIEESDWILNNNYDSQLVNNEQALADYVNQGGSLTDRTGQFLNAEGSDIYAINYFRFKNILLNHNSYIVRFYIETENGYIEFTEYKFRVEEQLLKELEGFTLRVDSTSIECLEEGIMKVYLSTEDEITGNYVLSRLSEKDNYHTATMLTYIHPLNHKYQNEIIFEDFTIESGIGYRYILQMENANGIRSVALREEVNPTHTINFQYSYLYHNGIQLKLKYDNTISTFKHTRLASKQDTIGGKYPVIFKNNYANYAEFPITGTITLHLDENEKFFKKKDLGYYYGKDLVIPSKKYSHIEYNSGYTRDPDYPIIDGNNTLTVNTYNTNLTGDNIFIERIFREKVEDFLQNHDYKLFKSPTEGNIIVTLINVSLTPKQNLGRAIYSFNATAYEVMDCTMVNMANYGIIPTSGYEGDLNGTENTLLLGQLSGLFKGKQNSKRTGVESSWYWSRSPVVAQDLYQLIKEENEYPLSSGGIVSPYRYKFIRLNSFWIEPYPKLDFDKELLIIQSHISQILNIPEEERTPEQEEELAKWQAKYTETEELKRYIEGVQIGNPVITLQVTTPQGERFISVGAGRVYTLRDMEITSMYLQYDEAIVLNYTCEVDVEENPEMIDKSITTTTMWDQLAGIFTETGIILNNYDGSWKQSPTLEVQPIEEHKIAGLYKSKNILNIIKEKTKEDVERNEGVTFTEYNEETNEWSTADHTLYYTFGEIVSIQIEADRGTMMNLGTHEEPETIIMIGGSNKYVLRPSESLINYISFINPTYAIIDFKTRVILKRKGVL